MRQEFRQASDMPEDALERTLSMIFRESPRNSVRMMFVSCWHVSEYESAAMWSHYVQHGIGVVVRSSVARLIESLADAPDLVQIGQVHYVDFQTAIVPGGNAFWPLLVKRLSFDHERELRAIVIHAPLNSQNALDFDVAPEHLLVPIDLSQLIEAIYVAPGAWYADVVREVLLRFGLTCDVRQSSMDDKPLQ